MNMVFGNKHTPFLVHYVLELNLGVKMTPKKELFLTLSFYSTFGVIVTPPIWSLNNAFYRVKVTPPLELL